jgi:hypothetical protein
MAFLLIDTALDFLLKKPKTGTDLNLFDRKFLFTVDEFIEGNSTLVRDVNKACPESCEVLKSYIFGPYDLWMSSGESLSGLVVRDLADEMEISSKKLLMKCNQVWPGSWSSNRELTLSQIKFIKNHFAKNGSKSLAGDSVPVSNAFSEFSEDNWMKAIEIEVEKLFNSGDPFVIAASDDDIDAMVRLGQMAEAETSTDRNLWLARHWYRNAASKGDINAMLFLADLLERMGVIEEPDGAWHWYRAAALTGDDSAMNNYGVFLYSREDHIEEAIDWVKKARDLKPEDLTYQGNLDTFIEFALDFANSLKKQKKFSDAEIYYLIAAEAGNISAMKNMASLLVNTRRFFGFDGAERWLLRLVELENTKSNQKRLAKLLALKTNKKLRGQ